MGKIEDAMASMARNLEEKTGTSLTGWVKRARSGKLDKHGAIVSFLKTQHGLGHGYANLVASAALAPANSARGADPLDAIYAGSKAPLRVLHEKLSAGIDKLGSSEKSPKKTYISFRRNKQFAMLGPATTDAVELGLNAKSLPPSARLKILAPGSMCQYAVRISTPREIDAELMAWVRFAYEAAG
jgi:hypothetical protein